MPADGTLVTGADHTYCWRRAALALDMYEHAYHRLRRC
jgi:hypothetical protein